jgi:hypothetical protein
LSACHLETHCSDPWGDAWPIPMPGTVRFRPLLPQRSTVGAGLTSFADGLDVLACPALRAGTRGGDSVRCYRSAAPLVPGSLRSPTDSTSSRVLRSAQAPEVAIPSAATAAPHRWCRAHFVRRRTRRPRVSCAPRRHPRWRFRPLLPQGARRHRASCATSSGRISADHNLALSRAGDRRLSGVHYPPRPCARSSTVEHRMSFLTHLALPGEPTSNGYLLSRWLLVRVQPRARFLCDLDGEASSVFTPFFRFARIDRGWLPWSKRRARGPESPVQLRPTSGSRMDHFSRQVSSNGRTLGIPKGNLGSQSLARSVGPALNRYLATWSCRFESGCLLQVSLRV